jgi:SAM-dependent MidA family methyltransferase
LVASAASEARLRVAGFTTQAHFLIGCGIEHYLSGADAQPMMDRMQLARQAMMLTLPGEMGERFKVLGLAANYDHPLCGFSVRDMAAAL